MGKQFIDQYSLLHFAFGIVAYFFSISIEQWFLIHLVFEITENSKLGMEFINLYTLNYWPGGKPYADSFINSFGDTIFALSGWIFASIIDDYGQKYKLYE